MKRVLWLVLVLVILATLFFTPDLWRYLFFLRLPITMGALLLLLPLLAKTALAAMLKNLFVLRSVGQLAAVIVGAIGSGMAVVLVASIILSNAPDRLNIAPSIEMPNLLQYGAAIV